MNILGHRDNRSRRKWGKGEIGYVCEHGSWGESWAEMGRALDRTGSACAALFFRASTTHERACRERALDPAAVGRPPEDPDPIVVIPGVLVGECFGNNVRTEMYGTLGRSSAVLRGQSSLADL